MILMPEKDKTEEITSELKSALDETFQMMSDKEKNWNRTEQ